MSGTEASTRAWTPWRPAQPETDAHGEPITEGCRLRRVVRGSVLPGITAEGIASRLPGDADNGLLYIREVVDGRERFINAWNREELEVLP
ncbi:hypothetical protein GCM10025867_45870 (plasmid) [Frondihabitans sucicola]|uniref:Uncharacterized protein n=1 Tax=Frondihabitans sucicola TaxID=1268041 RepID=A0ABM8GV50_9MICO|nr:hypothetical protein [Frondihabitans sucicola]BDZ52346.1 hypothetical protein GCM10025867_45870 [Frondihabitans sucicola]